MDDIEQSLYWPEPMLREMGEQGNRLHKNLSWCAQRAWTLSRHQLRALPLLAEPAHAHATYLSRYASVHENGKTNKRRQTLLFPVAMLEEIKEEAQRQDRSLSWIMQQAWFLAVSEIEKLPVDSKARSNA
ncbi:MAG: hypothetical protein NVS3B20_06760 [Polyangiales bacterium]